MFTEKDLVAGETVLVWNASGRKCLYLGSVLVTFKQCEFLNEQ